MNHMDNDDLLGIQQSQQKRNNIVNSLGMPHFNGLQSKCSQIFCKTFSSNRFCIPSAEYNSSADYFHSPPANERFSQILHQHMQQNHQQQPHQHQSRQQPNNLPGDSFSHVYAGNMSKFFDFHKNQQQQLQQTQQQQFLLNGHSSGSQHSAGNDHMNMASLLDNNRLGSQFLDHSNGKCCMI